MLLDEAAASSCIVRFLGKSKLSPECLSYYYHICSYLFGLLNIHIMIWLFLWFLDRDTLVSSCTISRRLFSRTNMGFPPIPRQWPPAFLPSLSLRELIPLQSCLFCPSPYLSRSKEPDNLRQEDTDLDGCAE